MPRTETHITVVASVRELPPDSRVWGTGGWLPPLDRQALDWITLARFMGWKVRVAWLEQDPREQQPALHAPLLILASDPGALPEPWLEAIAELLHAETSMVLAPVAERGTAWSHLAAVGRICEVEAAGTLSWSGPARPWASVLNTPCPVWETALEQGAAIWATLGGFPVLAARQFSRGVLASLCFDPSAARDRCPAATALLKRALAAAPLLPAPPIDPAGLVVLRMDDPGGSQNIFSRRWSYPKLDPAAWRRTGDILRAFDARLSVGYICGWVDDGDRRRGRLTVDGQEVARLPGAVYDSPSVVYEDHSGHAPGTLFDLNAEYRAIRALQDEGLLSVEPHGYTHMHPDRQAWAAADDRYDEKSWYRELGRRAEPLLRALPAAQRPVALGVAAVERFFGVRPTTLICPGEEFTQLAVEDALDAGLSFVGSYYLALRLGERFCWSTHCCAPYLDLAQGSWLEAGLPAVACFHDRDLVLHGPSWLERQLEAWVLAGARRFIDYRTLADLLGAGA